MSHEIEKKRFEEKIRITPGCWVWIGGKHANGYGFFKAKQKMWKAHRYSYELYVEPIASGMFILHRCDNPECVNPDHLRQGTALDNARDRDSRGRTNPPVGERARAAKLIEAQVRSIFSDKRLHKLIMDEYKISRHTIGDIKSGRRWSHLKLVGEKNGS